MDPCRGAEGTLTVGCGTCTALEPEIAQWQRDHASEMTIAVADAGSTQSNGPRRQDLRDIVADGVLASGSITPFMWSPLFRVSDVSIRPRFRGLAQRYVERVVDVIDVIELSSVPSPAAPFAVADMSAT